MDHAFLVIPKKSFLIQGHKGFLSLLFSGLLKSLNHLWWPLVAEGLLIQETTPLGFMLCTIKITIAGFTLGSPGYGSPHRLWAYDPPYSVAHYDLDHGNCTPQTWHGYQGPLKIGWSDLWVLWHIPPVGAGGFHCPQSLARCHGAGGAHPSTRLLGYQRNPLGLMELRAVRVLRLCNWHY